MMVSYDETGTIGKRYRRADAVGTPFAVTVDDETLENGTVALRNRDTMEQEKVAVDALAHYISRNTQLSSDANTGLNGYMFKKRK